MSTDHDAKPGRSAGLRTLDGSRNPAPDRNHPVFRVIRGGHAGSTHEEENAEMPQTAAQYPRKFTEIVDTPHGPAEVEITEHLWDLGDGPEVARWVSAPGWALGIKGGRVGEVNPDRWTSLDIHWSYHPGEHGGKVEVMLFGPADDDQGEIPETLWEKDTVHLSPQDARLFARQLLDAAERAEEAMAETGRANQN